MGGVMDIVLLLNSLVCILCVWNVTLNIIWRKNAFPPSTQSPPVSFHRDLLNKSWNIHIVEYNAAMEENKHFHMFWNAVIPRFGGLKEKKCMCRLQSALKLYTPTYVYASYLSKITKKLALIVPDLWSDLNGSHIF